MSNIDMECPLCHTELEIPDEFDGQKVKCPSCSKLITVSDPRIARETSKKTFRVNRGAMESYTPSPVLQQKSGGLSVPVIIGLVLLMVVTIGVSITAIVMVIENKKLTEMLNKRVTEFAELDRQNKLLNSPNLELKQQIKSEPEPIKTGKLVVYATWKYNDYVGNKADTGAMVMLRPKKCELKPQIMSNGLDLIKYDETLKKEGFLFSEVNGFGKAVFNKVPVGDYVCIIQSEHTNNIGLDDLAKSTGDLLSRFFEGDYIDAAKGAKFHTEYIKIEDGAEQEISYDFGITGYSPR